MQFQISCFFHRISVASPIFELHSLKWSQSRSSIERSRGNFEISNAEQIASVLSAEFWGVLPRRDHFQIQPPLLIFWGYRSFHLSLSSNFFGDSTCLGREVSQGRVPDLKFLKFNDEITQVMIIAVWRPQMVSVCSCHVAVLCILITSQILPILSFYCLRNVFTC